jgi:hypothetical protein
MPNFAFFNSKNLGFTNFMKIIFTAIFCICVYSVFAQNTKTVFHITDKIYSPLWNATISVISKKDSTNILNKISDTLGNAQLTLVNGAYKVTVAAVGYKPLEKNITVSQTQNRFNLPLEIDVKAMTGVVVTARKSLMRQEDDKTIVDPENLANSSTNAYEVMEKIPGIYIDQDGNIMLNSTSPSAIWINGREQKMSNADIATLLKSLPPNSIEKIEIVRTPSARYDASGGGGIVNIVLKKNIKLGTTGSISSSISQGRYGNQQLSFNLNNSNGDLSTYLNMNVEKHNSYDESSSQRFFAPDSVVNQHPYSTHPGYGSFVGFGLNNRFNKQWDVSLDTRFSANRSFDDNLNNSSIEKISTSSVLSSNQSRFENNGGSVNFSQGISSKYKIDSLGSEWMNDLSYTFVPNNNNQDLSNAVLTPLSYISLVNGDLANKSHFLSFQSNLIKKYAKKLTIEAGIKTSNVWFSNDTKYFNQIGGTKVVDTRRTNAFHYRENIHAAYLQASKTFGSIVLKTGIRLENTNMVGFQTVPTDTSFKVSRIDPFPYIYLSRSVAKIGEWDLRAYLVYRRTITRPSYSYLNPAIRISNPYMYDMGNPSLKPQFNQNYEANISVNDRPIFAFGINQTKDIFSQVVYKSKTNSNQAFQTYDNLGTNKETYFRLVGAIPPGKKYFFVAGTQYNHNLYNGLYNKLPFNYQRGSWSVFTYHNYKVLPNFQLSMHGFMRMKGVYNFYEMTNFGSMNFNMTQFLLKKKMTITASIADLFYTNNSTAHLKQGDLEAISKRWTDSRRFGFNIRYNFGIRKKDEKNKMDDMFGGGNS